MSFTCGLLKLKVRILNSPLLVVSSSSISSPIDSSFGESLCGFLKLNVRIRNSPLLVVSSSSNSPWSPIGSSSSVSVYKSYRWSFYVCINSLLLMHNIKYKQFQNTLKDKLIARLGAPIISSYSAASNSCRWIWSKNFGSMCCRMLMRRKNGKGKRIPTIGIQVIPKQINKYTTWNIVKVAMYLKGTVST